MVKHKIKFKPFILNVSTEREAIYNKIKGHMKKLELMVNNPNTDDTIKLKAMSIHLRMASVVKGILKDVGEEEFKAQLDELERQIGEDLKELTQELAQRKAEDRRRF